MKQVASLLLTVLADGSQIEKAAAPLETILGVLLSTIVSIIGAYYFIMFILHAASLARSGGRQMQREAAISGLFWAFVAVLVTFGAGYIIFFGMSIVDPLPGIDLPGAD